MIAFTKTRDRLKQEHVRLTDVFNGLFYISNVTFEGSVLFTQPVTSVSTLDSKLE